MTGPKETIDIIQLIKSNWEKKSGLLACIILLIFIFLYIVSKYEIGINVALLTFAIFAIGIFTFWYVSTNRFLINKVNKLGVYISINCDNEFEQKAKSIFEKVIVEINRDPDLKMLYAEFIPSNKFSNHTEIETWLDKQNGVNNAIIFLKIKNGNINSEEAIKIDNVTYTGYFRKNNLKLNGENLNITNDLNLRLQNTDWNYFEKNCLEDKEKFRNNLRDLILYYGGMFYLNETQFENSRIILKKLYSPNPSIVQSNNNLDNSNSTNLETDSTQVKAGRLNYLLTNIYLKCVIDKYDNNDIYEAIKYLHEIESFPVSTDLKTVIYINLAYMYYMAGNMERSKNYTELVHSVNPKSFAYRINLGYYAIIENNITTFSQHYTILDENMTLDSQPLEIIAFLNDRIGYYPNSQILFESAEAILTKLFVDENDGNEKTKILLSKIPDSKQNKALKKLLEKTLKKKLSKKSQRQQYKAKKAPH
ncbi:MAG: hypothetical protein AB7O73_09880 [Bacteroidia bacterium]